MNYDKIIETIKQELSKESELREEIIYKKGFAEGVKYAKEEFKEDFEEVDTEEIEATAYLDGLQDACEMISSIIELPAEEKISLYNTACLKEILDDNDAITVFNSYLIHRVMGMVSDNQEKEPIEEDPKSELIGDVLDSSMSDENKRIILAIIDVVNALGEDFKVVRI